MTITENKISKLFAELVPTSGKADTVAGEIIRAISRIGYRFYNDGDQIGIGYGKETCNPAARYLMEYTDKEIDAVIVKMWGEYSEDVYEGYLHELEDKVLAFLENHPETKTTKNYVDMWSCFNKDEDTDDCEEDEEDW